MHAVPPPERDPGAYVDAIAACARSEGYEVVLAADDIELVAPSAGRDRLPCLVPNAPTASCCAPRLPAPVRAGGARLVTKLAGVRVPNRLYTMVRPLG